jgi:hypothetical protein
MVSPVDTGRSRASQTGPRRRSDAEQSQRDLKAATSWTGGASSEIAPGRTPISAGAVSTGPAELRATSNAARTVAVTEVDQSMCYSCDAELVRDGVRAGAWSAGCQRLASGSTTASSLACTRSASG